MNPDLIFKDGGKDLCVMRNISYDMDGTSTWSAEKCDAWNLSGETVKFSSDYNEKKQAIRAYTRVMGDRLCVAIIDPEACHRD